MLFIELTSIFNFIGHTGDFPPFIYFSRVIIFNGQENGKEKVHVLPHCLGFKTCILLFCCNKKKVEFSYIICYIICISYNISLYIYNSTDKLSYYTILKLSHTDSVSQ